jgi:hypothetical protein
MGARRGWGLGLAAACKAVTCRQFVGEAVVLPAIVALARNISVASIVVCSKGHSAVTTAPFSRVKLQSV